MANENELLEVSDIIETQDDDGNDTTDWKTIAMERHELAKKNFGIGQRYKGKYRKLKDQGGESKKTETEPKKNNQSDLDYGQKAYLAANGVKGKDELKIVQDYLESGKSLEDILENKHFQQDLKDLRDSKAVEDALPHGSKRAGGAPRDSVEYWLNKGELPPATEVELRRKVVNAKIQKSKNAGMFYNT